jgi:hypothetical protein
MIKNLFFMFLISSSGFSETTMMLADGFKKGDSVPVSVVSLQQAESLFKEFADEELAFDQPEGCFAKATAMARIAEKQKLEMAKVWVHGHLMKGITYQGYSGELNFHVAPVLYVKNKTNKPELLVFDPFLFGKPVTVDEWTKKLKSGKGSIGELYYSARFQFRNKDIEEKKYSWHSEDLDSMEEILGKLNTDKDAAEISNIKTPQEIGSRKKQKPSKYQKNRQAPRENRAVR